MAQNEVVKPHRKSVELRSYHDDQYYHIVMSAHSDILSALPLAFHPNLSTIIKESLHGYMPVHQYDANGSNVRCFANDYVRITHKVKFSSCDEVTPILRENVSDLMFQEGWDLVGFAAHQGPSLNTSSTTVVEKWVKIM